MSAFKFDEDRILVKIFCQASVWASTPHRPGTRISRRPKVCGHDHIDLLYPRRSGTVRAHGHARAQFALLIPGLNTHASWNYGNDFLIRFLLDSRVVFVNAHGSRTPTRQNRSATREAGTLFPTQQRGERTATTDKCCRELAIQNQAYETQSIHCERISAGKGGRRCTGDGARALTRCGWGCDPECLPGIRQRLSVSLRSPLSALCSRLCHVTTAGRARPTVER